MARCGFRLARGGPVINIASLVNIGDVERAVSHSHELPSVTPPLRLGSWAVCYDTQGCGQRGGVQTPSRVAQSCSRHPDTVLPQRFRHSDCPASHTQAQERHFSFQRRRSPSRSAGTWTVPPALRLSEAPGEPSVTRLACLGDHRAGPYGHLPASRFSARQRKSGPKSPACA